MLEISAFNPLGRLHDHFCDSRKVSDLHDPALICLHIIAHAGHKNHTGHIPGQSHELDFILANTHVSIITTFAPEASSTVATSAVVRAVRPAIRASPWLPEYVNPGSRKMLPACGDAVTQNRPPE